MVIARRHAGSGDHGCTTPIGVAPGGFASSLPTRMRSSLGGGGAEMLERVILYTYVVTFAASLLLEKAIPLAIGP